MIDPDADARRALARHRQVATGLLLLMAALTLGSYALPPGWGAELLQSAAKAGFVGGIADWFAVTALFRHPLGLPIPHTAILPAQKRRLGRALGNFVANHVVTPVEVGRVLSRIDLPAIIGRYLASQETARPAAEALAAMLPRLLSSVEDGRARRLAARLVPRMVGGVGAGRLVARALRAMVAGGRHHAVLDFVIAELRRTLTGKEGQLRLAIEERVREQGGRLVGWAIGATIATRVLVAVNAELDKVGPESGLREAFDEWVEREIAKMESDPDRAREVGAALRGVLAQDTVQAWLWDLWSRLRRTMEADALRPDGRTVPMIEAALANLGRLLQTDEAARARMRAALETAIASLLPGAREEIATFIGGVIGNWDSATLVDRLELRVGKDLQYIRVNGTLVGFLVGGLVWALLRATFGRVAF